MDHHQSRQVRGSGRQTGSRIAADRTKPVACRNYACIRERSRFTVFDIDLQTAEHGVGPWSIGLKCKPEPRPIRSEIEHAGGKLNPGFSYRGVYRHYLFIAWQFGHAWLRRAAVAGVASEFAVARRRAETLPSILLRG